MTASPIDYAALAKQSGALLSTPPPAVDYAALAKQSGALSSAPAMTPAQMQAKGDRYAALSRNQDPPVEPLSLSSIGQGISDVGKGLVNTFLHPIGTATGMLQAQGNEGDRAIAAFKASDYAEAGTHALAYLTPVVGPMAVSTGEMVGSGHPGRAVGQTAAMLVADRAMPAAQDLAVGAVKGTAGAIADTAANARLLPRSGTPVQRAAVDWAMRQGAPLDAAAATLNPIVRGTQEIAKGTFGAGSAAESAIQARNQWYADKGRAIAEQVSPTPQTPETAGRAIGEQGIQTIQQQNTGANEAYADLRSYEADPKNSRDVQTGTKAETRQMSGVVDADGNPTSQSVTRQVPVIENVPMPVDMRPFKDRFAGVLTDIQRQTRLGQSQYAPAQIALEDLVNGPDFKPASVAEKDLGALKRVSDNNTLTGGVKNDAGALAAQSIPDLQKAIDSAVETTAGPDALASLRSGRLQTAGKYAAIDLVDQFKAEPVKLFQQLTTAKDSGIDLLRQVQKLAPEQTPALGRAWLDGALNQATESGGFAHADKIFADWQKLGPETKKVLFKSPLMVSDLDNFFQSAKDSAKIENTSGTAKVGHLQAQGGAFGAGVALAVTGHPLALAGQAGLTIAGNALSRLLYNPRFVRFAIRAMKTDAGSAGAAAAASDLVKAAGSDAVPVAPAAATAPTPGPAAATAAAASTETAIPVPGGSGAGYKAAYKLRELADVQASHSGQTFNANPKYTLSNDRDYANAVNQGKIIAGASRSEFKPALHITDNADATNGPVITDAAGQVLGGNGRKMMLDRVYSGNPQGAAAYREMLKAKASQFGLDPAAVDGMKQPVLTREIPDSELTGANAKQKAVTDFNKVGTASMTPAERAISDSRRVSQGTLDDVASRLNAKGENATLAQVLEDKSGLEVLDKLIKDGVIAPGERAGLAEADKLTPAGKARITSLTIARFFADPAQIDTISPLVRAKVERIAAPLAQIEGKGGAWSLTPHIADALSMIEQARKLRIGNIDDFVAQDGLFGAQQHSPEAVILARALKDGKSGDLLAAVRQYAGDASHASKGANTLFGDAPSPETAFDAAFGQPAKLAANALAEKTRAKGKNALAPGEENTK